MKKKVNLFHILGLNLKISYQIVSLFDMYIDMGERIAGKQDRPSQIIEGPPQGPLNSPKYTFLCHGASSVRRSTPVTRQPIFGSFSNLVGIFLQF